ncbi:enoyl-CoA hydratase-related protein [Laceyella putida]|uniref:Enoyl-CoA hydratase-related protein n=1 Tax=Laceyella putida TaxID=110101 RepID=A0ABW2RG93_9BACL
MSRFETDGWHETLQNREIVGFGLNITFEMEGIFLSNWKHILCEQGEGWALLTLTRPKVLNALSREVLMELDAAIDWVEQNDAVRVLIVTGAGEKAFVAGADIAELSQIASSEEAERTASYGQRVFARLEELEKPVIMAINGFALGGGMELAMCGDILLASANARFGQPEINLGVIPGYGGTQRLSRLVGRQMAKYLCMTGEMLSADEAVRCGIVQKVVPQEALLEEAKRLAETLVKKAPIALKYIKKAIHNGIDIDLPTGLKLEASYFGLTFDTHDRKEGMDAFLEKRAPRFTGK